MYERTFGTDWDDLTRAEAIERAFALGVATACGHDVTEEYDRVKEGLPRAYDRSIVELAFEEGRTRALGLEADEEEEVWETLVDGDGTPIDAPLPAAMPGAVRELELLRRDDGGPPGSLGLPSFLRK